jgi:hypothetical protein
VEELGSGSQLEDLFLADIAHKSPSMMGRAGFHHVSSHSSEYGQGGPAQPDYTHMKYLGPKPSDLGENKKPSNGGGNQVSEMQE